MFRILFQLCLAASLLLSPAVAAGRTWLVAADGSGDFQILSGAYAAAASGDTVSIAPGHYEEADDVVVRDKSITTLGSGSDPRDVSLRITIFFYDSPFVSLQNVWSHDNWVAFVVTGSSQVEIYNCVFENNQGPDGSAVIAYASQVSIRESSFLNNRADLDLSHGGAIWVDANLSLQDCEFRNNYSTVYGGAVVARQSTITSCVFSGNRSSDGAAVFLMDGCEVRNCTFWRNQGWSSIYADGPNVRIENCIVVETVGGFAVQCNNFTDIGCCDFWNNEVGRLLDCPLWGPTGNFDADPLLCRPDQGDFGLDVNSPCLPDNQHDSTCGLVGAHGAACGDTPVRTMTWGRVKATYHDPAREGR